MRLKTKLVLAITGLVFMVVCTLSWIFLGQLLRQRLTQAYSANDMVAHQILFATRRALESNVRGVDAASDPAFAEDVEVLRRTLRDEWVSTVAAVSAD